MNASSWPVLCALSKAQSPALALAKHRKTLTKGFGALDQSGTATPISLQRLHRKRTLADSNLAAKEVKANQSQTEMVSFRSVIENANHLLSSDASTTRESFTPTRQQAAANQIRASQGLSVIGTPKRSSFAIPKITVRQSSAVRFFSF